MPTVNIERAIAKGSGEIKNGDTAIEAIRYEGYGPGGVAIIVEALTDNRNRTAADLRLAFNKHGGKLGENGCVVYLFEHRSEIHVKTAFQKAKKNHSEETLIETLLNLEANSYELIQDRAIIYGPFTALEALHEGLTERGWSVEEAFR